MFKPTDDQRRTVMTMAGYGIKHEDIGFALKIDPKTLRKHFRDELDEGMARANINIGRSLYELAVGRAAEINAQGVMVREELKADKSAAIFLGKARLGLRETSRVEMTGADGGPIAHTIDIDLSVLDDEELQQFMRLYEKARRASRALEEAAAGPLLIGGHKEA